MNIGQSAGATPRDLAEGLKAPKLCVYLCSRRMTPAMRVVSLVRNIPPYACVLICKHVYIDIIYISHIYIYTCISYLHIIYTVFIYMCVCVSCISYITYSYIYRERESYSYIYIYIISIYTQMSYMHTALQLHYNYCYFHASGCPLLQPFPDYKNTQAGVSSKSKRRTKGNKGDLSTVPSTRGS